MTNQLRVALPIGGWAEPWPRVFELANALPLESWVLVGGLMVQAHAYAAGVRTERVTVDIDAAVRIEARGFSYSDAAAAVQRLGYVVDDGTKFAYRFRRDAAVIDLMVADHEYPPPRHGRREVMAVTGGHQALSRSTSIVAEADDGDVVIPVPDLHGALVLKSAAHVVDSRNRERHLIDAITLLACIVDVDVIIGALAGSDRRRLMALIKSLDDDRISFAQVPIDTARLAQRTLMDLRDGLPR